MLQGGVNRSDLAVDLNYNTSAFSNSPILGDAGK